MEDDVLLPTDFEAKMAVVNEYLDTRRGKWDLFAGIIASLHPETKVLSVEAFKGMMFATINRMTSMVFNIYAASTLRLLASWNPDNLDADCNTIDRFLESHGGLRVVVVLPFLVAHREELRSTLWGFKNIQYRDMIAGSERALQGMALAYQRDNSVPRRKCA